MSTRIERCEATYIAIQHDNSTTIHTINDTYMNKNFTFTAFALCLGIAAVAQTTTIRVQGAPRKVSTATAARLQKAAKATTSTGIDFSKIQRWAGTGDCQAALAIKWADGQNEGKTLVWGYRWNSSETKTGEDLVRAIAKADPALYMMATNNSWGFYLGGFGYDGDGDRYVTLTTMTDEIYPRNGVFDIPSSEFPTSASTKWGDGDSWNTGADDYSTYWSYYVADNANDALAYAQTGATGRTLTDGCVDAYVFADGQNEYDGNMEYLPATTDFTNGTFLLNEGSFGHGNADVNFLSADGTWTYRNTTEIGATGCFAAAWGNRYYIMAKQAKDNGSEVTGGRITICDANSMRIIKQIENIGSDGGDGRSFCGIDEHRAYVGTTNGIYELDLDNMEITKTVLTTKNTNIEFGNMVRLGDYVYACEYGKNLHVINCNDNSLVKTIPADAYSIIMSKDGQLWVSTATGISRVNTTALELDQVSLGDGIDAPANSAGMWNPDGLCASLQNNVIYWTSSANWMTQKVYRYDIDKANASLLLDYTSDADSRNIYGAAFRVDPKTDCLYANLVKGWTYTDNVVRKYTADGTLLAEYPMKEAYWFPEVFVFPDTEDPQVGNINAINVEVGKTSELNLADVCTDADNFQAAIVKTVESVDDESIATVNIKDGKLTVEGLKEGTTDVTVKFCSNGIATTTKVSVTVSTATAVNSATTNAERHEVARFTTDGKRIQKPQQGMNIVKFSDGSVEKVMVK